MLATIVDRAALWQVVVSSFVVSVAVTTLFTSGLVLVAPGRPLSAARRALGGPLLLASSALVAGGLYVVFTTR
jgi:hypothetical protein